MWMAMTCCIDGQQCILVANVEIDSTEQSIQENIWWKTKNLATYLETASECPSFQRFLNKEYEEFVKCDFPNKKYEEFSRRLRSNLPNSLYKLLNTFVGSDTIEEYFASSFDYKSAPGNFSRLAAQDFRTHSPGATSSATYREPGEQLLTPDQVTPGTRVSLQGLPNGMWLNGLLATVIAPPENPKGKRPRVYIQGDYFVVPRSVRIQNLTLAD